MSASEAEEQFDENTYSTIFSALKHPIRRRILRMLFEKPLSFTGILNQLSISSPQLSFHIKSLRELTRQTEDEKYSLSVFGKAACSLMGIVEEPERTGSRMIDFKWAFVALLLALFMPFVVYEPGPFGAWTAWRLDLGLSVAIGILVYQYFKSRRPRDQQEQSCRKEPLSTMTEAQRQTVTEPLSHVV